MTMTTTKIPIVIATFMISVTVFKAKVRCLRVLEEETRERLKPLQL